MGIKCLQQPVKLVSRNMPARHGVGVTLNPTKQTGLFGKYLVIEQ
jgi:hypothetical protein